MKMNSNIKLPSNRKFGYFFTLIFLIASIYFYFREINLLFYILGTCTIVFFLVTFLRAEILMPLNKLWMSFGLLLGGIISPIIMAAIFFIIFTPVGILMRLFGRDELFLKFKTRDSYWTSRNEDIQSYSFRKQF